MEKTESNKEKMDERRGVAWRRDEYGEEKKCWLKFILKDE